MDVNQNPLARIEAYLAQGKHDRALTQVEKRVNHLATQRWANGDSPIYMIKKRVKSPESVYLKLKRRNLKDSVDLDRLGDIAGIRILILYDQDLEEVVQFLANQIVGDGCLTDLDCYGFTDSEQEGISRMIPEDKRHPDYLRNNSQEAILRKASKRSAYKSLHFTFQEDCSGESVIVELQLRTLLQDVWAELEHRLAYKQGIMDPFIFSGFSHIQSDLATMARRLADIRQRRRELDLLYHVSLHDSLPYTYFKTEGGIFPHHPLFEAIQDDYMRFQERLRHLVESGIIGHAVLDDTLAKLEHLQNRTRVCSLEVHGQAGPSTVGEGDLIYPYRLIFAMEFAYLYILRKRFQEAQQIYADLSASLEGTVGWEGCYLRPILYFRQGELFLRNNQAMSAFAKFDLCEQSLMALIADQPGNAVLHLNGFMLKKSLADIYWHFGSQDFIDLSWQLAQDALVFFKRAVDLDADSLEPAATISMFNKLCWYATEKFRIREPDNAALLLDALAYHRQLLAFLDDAQMEPFATSNDYDTVAWCCYVAYQHFGLIQDQSIWPQRKEAIEDAKFYCDKMVERRNASSYMTTSYNLHLGHAQQIHLAYAEKDRVEG